MVHRGLAFHSLSETSQILKKKKLNFWSREIPQCNRDKSGPLSTKINMFSRERSDLLLCFHKISALWINRKFEPHQRCCPEPADTELPQAQEGNFSCFFPTRRAPFRQFALCSWCLCSHRGVRPCLHIQWGDLRRPSPGLGKSLCPAAAQPYWGKECRELPAIPLPRSQGNAGKEKGACKRQRLRESICLLE